MNLYFLRVLGRLLLGSVVVSLVTRTQAQTFTSLHTFGGSPSDGAEPDTALVQGSDGNFYGTTIGGGTHDRGTVFRITPSGAETVLYSFGTNANDGLTPFSALIQGSDGNFYGTTLDGFNGAGTVFKITPSGTETVLYSFAADMDGALPNGVIQGSDGNFYGTTQKGGANLGGTVFKITPSGTETVLYNFSDVSSNDGTRPQSALVEGSDGNFYGTTYFGGTNGAGTVFRITPSGAETVLYSFFANPNDAEGPQSALVEGSDGNFYGTTTSGGTANVGTVYRITPLGTETVIYNFGANPNDAQVPAGLIKGSDGNLYGAAGGGSHGIGTVFKVRLSGTEAELYNFGTSPNDGLISRFGGQMSSVLVEGSDGNLYGTTPYTSSPDDNSGTVFKLSLPGPRANNDQAVLVSASPVTIDVMANDSDPDDLPLSVTAVTQPSSGQVKINGDGTITYTPHQSFAKFSGTDSFTYTASNGSRTGTATVTIGNPFYLQKGNFAGTLGNVGGGYLTLTISGTGAFTGRLRLGMTAFALKGQFDTNGDYTATVGGQVLSLFLDAGNLTGNASGSYTIFGDYGGFGLDADHAIYNAASNPAPQAGYYTMLLPAVMPASATVPSGTGYARLAVSEGGKVAMVGVLADGTKISDGVFITGGGTDFVNHFPVYVNLPYKAAGSLVGRITFEDQSGVSDCDGLLDWYKPAQIAAGIYKVGFDTTLSAIGSRYAKPPAGVLALNLATGSPNANVDLTEPDFVTTTTKRVTVAIGGVLNTDSVTINNPSTDALVMSINSKTGLFLGTFKHPVSGITVKLQGALLHKQNVAGGYFIGPVQSGAVSLAAP